MQVGLSIDTTTVGGNADMFGIMRLALNLHHLHSRDVLEVQPRRVLELATIDGARTLGLADRVGSLVEGGGRLGVQDPLALTQLTLARSVAGRARWGLIVPWPSLLDGACSCSRAFLAAT